MFTLSIEVSSPLSNSSATQYIIFSPKGMGISLQLFFFCNFNSMCYIFHRIFLFRAFGSSLDNERLYLW